MRTLFSQLGVITAAMTGGSTRRQSHGHGWAVKTHRMGRALPTGAGLGGLARSCRDVP
jgi:hypothetical protein